jgi:hypothetical protein
MKSIVLFLLLAGSTGAFGQTGTNLVAVGDWSEPVTDPDRYAVQGRLLVYKKDYESHLDANLKWFDTRLYLEFRQFTTLLRFHPIGIYFRLGSFDRHLELRDGSGNAVPLKGVGPIQIYTDWWGWLIVPYDSTIRVRAKPEIGVNAIPAGAWHIVLQSTSDGGEEWVIPHGDTNDYFLSATYTTPTNRPASSDYHVWQGTINFPKVKLSPAAR